MRKSTMRMPHLATRKTKKERMMKRKMKKRRKRTWVGRWVLFIRLCVHMYMYFSSNHSIAGGSPSHFSHPFLWMKEEEEEDLNDREVDDEDEEGKYKWRSLIYLNFSPLSIWLFCLYVTLQLALTPKHVFTGLVVQNKKRHSCENDSTLTRSSLCPPPPVFSN